MHDACLRAPGGSPSLRVALPVAALIALLLVGVVGGLFWPDKAWSRVALETDSKGGVDVALRAAEQAQDVATMERLGLVLFRQDQKAGLPWLQKAAQAGSARAALVLGIALFNGDGVAPNQAEGFAWIEFAHARGEATARQTLDQVLPLLSSQEAAQGRQRSRELLAVMTKSSAVAAAAAPKAKMQNRPQKNAGNSTANLNQDVATSAVSLQLGSFSSVASAKAAWEQLGRRHTDLGSYTPSFQPFGALTRLRIADLDAQRGRALCVSLRRQGQPCLLVR